MPTTHKLRRVPLHKDDWVRKCQLLEIENMSLKNQLGQLRFRMERGGVRFWVRFGLAKLSRLV